MLPNINRPLPARTDIEVQMNGEYSLWRIFIPVEEINTFHNALNNIKAADNKNSLQSIHGGNSIYRYDTILTEKELLLLRLSVPGLFYSWTCDWIYATL